MTGDPATPTAIKTRIRKDARAAVAGMSQAERRAAEQQIAGRLARIVSDRRARWVLGYLALRDEVRIDAALAALTGQGVQVWLPRVVAGDLWLGRWRPTAQLLRDEEGVWAPVQAPLQGWPAGSGVVVTPGRGFDRSGGRVGRGRGYYDRLLSRPWGGHAFLVGIAYGRQIVERVPREPHDRDVDSVVTEHATYFARRKRAHYGADALDEETDDSESR